MSVSDEKVNCVSVTQYEMGMKLVQLLPLLFSAGLIAVFCDCSIDLLSFLPQSEAALQKSVHELFGCWWIKGLHGKEELGLTVLLTCLRKPVTANNWPGTSAWYILKTRQICQLENIRRRTL